nr:hypothetical protein Iba_scaffold15724CG0010 [Ipomoea batatas]GME20913.1 hypothetical protein Iba_scaffold26467CG0050 [Ipomoea batatas]
MISPKLGRCLIHTLNSITDEAFLVLCLSPRVFISPPWPRKFEALLTPVFKGSDLKEAILSECGFPNPSPVCPCWIVALIGLPKADPEPVNVVAAVRSFELSIGLSTSELFSLPSRLPGTYGDNVARLSCPGPANVCKSPNPPSEPIGIYGVAMLACGVETKLILFK